MRRHFAQAQNAEETCGIESFVLHKYILRLFSFWINIGPHYSGNFLLISPRYFVCRSEALQRLSHSTNLIRAQDNIQLNMCMKRSERHTQTQRKRDAIALDKARWMWIEMLTHIQIGMMRVFASVCVCLLCRIRMKFERWQWDVIPFRMLLYSMAKLTCNKIGKLRHLLVCIIPERKWAFICVTTETVFHICFLLSPLSIDTVSRLVYSDFIRIQFMSLCSCVRFQKSYCLGLASAEWQMLSIFGSSSTNQNNL